MPSWLGQLFDSNEKEINRFKPLVKQINDLEPQFQGLFDDDLKGRTAQFKQRLAEGETLDDLLPEAFAAVREASRRTIGLRHFDVQLMGGIVLHQGKIAEMKTGEGKTLVATLPLYLNALEGKGCHLVTVNDYLARRDAYWMSPVYNALGITVASIYPVQSSSEQLPALIYDPEYTSEKDIRWPHFKPVTRQEAYAAGITYGTNNEYGFDYLRDNMVLDMSQKVQRPLNYAIVDEVDNILIDEARTPLIISGAAHVDQAKKRQQQVRLEEFKKYKRVADLLVKDRDYTVDEKDRSIHLGESGHEIISKQFNLSAMEDFDDTRDKWKEIADEMHDLRKSLERFQSIESRNGVLSKEEIDQRRIAQARINELQLIDEKFIQYRETEKYMLNALRAKELFKLDRDYVIDKNGAIIIVDEFTGRLMYGRRYSEELHEAIEAKENITPQPRSVTLATITFQNYFKLYNKLAGMTGTAATEAEELYKIYKLDVIVIPTNKPMVRKDQRDVIYKDEDSKFKAIANEVEKLNKEGKPVLIGTVSIEKSEILDNLLMRHGVRHEVLNAKYHEREAEIIKQAGRTGAVTVATNMAGRGVDIILGGKPPEREEFEDENEFQKKCNEWKLEHDSIIALGGLHVIGTERHEARRIDNQLRGRAGRQGDPGNSLFFVSLEDDIVKRFGGERVKGVMEWAGMDENTAIEHPMISKAIENSQIKVEGYNFDIRKHLVDYDNVVNIHRETIYGERNKILMGADLKANILEMVEKQVEQLVDDYSKDKYGDIDLRGLLREIEDILPLPQNMADMQLEKLGKKQVGERLVNYARQVYELREKDQGPEQMRLLERLVMLKVIDEQWKDHLTIMDDLRQSVSLQSVRQVDPLVIYKKEGGDLFVSLKDNMQHEIVHTIYKVNIEKREAPVNRPSPVPGQKVGRNDPCPCGSGKKYKHCHGK